jgi:O-acetylhomoserine (thiol)-lyase
MTSPLPTQAFATQALHAGYTPDAVTHSRAVPLYQTTSYTFENSQHASDLFALKAFGNIYTRLMNPTNAVLEQRIAALEGGAAALAVASGHAAVTATVLTLCPTGSHIVASTDLYGGTINLFKHALKRLGIEVTFVPPNDVVAWQQAIQPNTKLLFTESLGNPKLDIVDLQALAEVAEANQLPLVVDNTLPTPALLRPIEHGAHIVIHSATKFIGGQGLSIGGLIVDSGRFDWVASPRFAEFSEPDPSYHGLNFLDTFGALTFIIRARVLTLRDFGLAASPFNCWTFINGAETLNLRMQQHSHNALALAQFLAEHPAVAWVNYPGLASSPTAHLRERYLPDGAGAIVGFGVKGGALAAQRVVESVNLFSHLANVGDTKSLIIHPASTTHSQLDDPALLAAGVTPEFVRLSVGIEAIADLKADLAQALAQAVPLQTV